MDEDSYNETKSDERVYLDLRASSGYKNEAEKLERNDSKINLEIVLKESAKNTLRVKSSGSFSRRVPIHIKQKWTNTTSKNIWYITTRQGLFRMKRKQFVGNGGT